MNKLFLLVLFLAVFGLSACATKSVSTVVSVPELEMLVTCNPTKEAEGVAKAMYDEDGYTKDGRYFFKPNDDIAAFGSTVLYTGIAGVDMLPGPNITVVGKPKGILERVKKVFSGEFECGNGGCVSKIDEDYFVAVYKHPTMKKTTIVQCGYLGQ